MRDCHVAYEFYQHELLPVFNARACSLQILPARANIYPLRFFHLQGIYSSGTSTGHFLNTSHPPSFETPRDNGHPQYPSSKLYIHVLLILFSIFSLASLLIFYSISSLAWRTLCRSATLFHTQPRVLEGASV